MKKWNAPEMVELAIECTEKDNGNTAITGSGYKWKTNQCECGHNTNFDFKPECPDGTHDIATDGTITVDSLS